MNRTSYLTISSMVIAVLAGCATTPNPNLDNARSSYRSAQSEPDVANFAGVELKRAGDTLARADDAWQKEKDTEEVDHLAYLTQKQVAIAQETAKRKAAEADVSAAGAERNKIRLSARTREAENAQFNAEMSQQEAERSQQQAQMYQQQAQSAEMRADALKSQLSALNAKKSERGLIVTLGDVLFDTNRAQLKSGGVRAVQKLADVLKQYPQRNIVIEGFTDSVGSDSHNQELSERRANAVRDTLMNMGVDSTRITTRGYGEGFPVAGNDNEAGRQMNRRVDVVISDESGNIKSRY